VTNLGKLLSDPDNAREFFLLLATANNCVITRFDFEHHVVEFNGADEDMKSLASDIADKFD
jgi:hypothetical protein